MQFNNDVSYAYIYIIKRSWKKLRRNKKNLMFITSPSNGCDYVTDRHRKGRKLTPIYIL
jgi:hypothetical protein